MNGTEKMLGNVHVVKCKICGSDNLVEISDIDHIIYLCLDCARLSYGDCEK